MIIEIWKCLLLSLFALLFISVALGDVDGIGISANNNNHSNAILTCFTNLNNCSKDYGLIFIYGNVKCLRGRMVNIHSVPGPGQIFVWLTFGCNLSLSMCVHATIQSFPRAGLWMCICVWLCSGIIREIKPYMRTYNYAIGFPLGQAETINGYFAWSCQNSLALLTFINVFIQVHLFLSLRTLIF